ncbi:MAG TPA: inner membrane CreD family protein [Candidatus Paceibacterota bacterium]
MPSLAFTIKVISIGIVIAVSFAASMFVYAVVNDRISYQQQALETHGGDASQVRIFNKLSGFDEKTGVSVYRKVERVLKYAILFILLTFGVFFLMDVMWHLQLHPVQYLLVGLGLAEFYLLLLALTEHIGFITAYIVAAAMTIALITLYSYFVLRTVRGAMGIAAMLTLVYTYLLIVLHLETYALLTGALLLFALLATIMMITRKIDWNRAFEFESRSK